MINFILEGNELRMARDKLGLSQARLSEITGISQARLSSFERGKGILSDKVVERINKLLSEGDAIKQAIERKRRYRNHEYIKPLKDDSRRLLAQRVFGNIDYLEILSKIERALIASPLKGPTALSLFSGCGGFSLGFASAGFKILGFVEINPEFRKIYKANFASSKELGTDITKITDLQIEDWKQQFGAVDVIIGGPPCQGFSLAGKRKTDDFRNTLFEHYLRVVDRIQPKFAVLENVRLLSSMRLPDGSLVADAIQKGFLLKGYDVRAFEINAKDYGVPQHRERIVFIAIRKDVGELPSVPSPTHGNGENLVRYLTFADACSDLEYLETGEASATDTLHKAVHHPKHVIDWLWNVAQGASAHDNSDPLMRPPSGYNTTYKRQIWLEPASTVQTTFGMISGCRNVHPIATRSLTIREAARIQSFPNTFKFVGSLGSIRASIGNAVPPLLAYNIGLHLREMI
jgi:DNA (cytosine-5)-methyltransferase 1